MSNRIDKRDVEFVFTEFCRWLVKFGMAPTTKDLGIQLQVGNRNTGVAYQILGTEDAKWPFTFSMNLTTDSRIAYKQLVAMNRIMFALDELRRNTCGHEKYGDTIRCAEISCHNYAGKHQIGRFDQSPLSR